MKNNVLTSTVSVSPQIAPEHVAEIAAAGFKTLLCNRPDGEGSDQPLFAEIEKAAAEHDLQVIYQPVSGKAMTQQDVTDFGTILDACPKPVLAFCRTGTRCANLWAYSEAAKGTPAEDIIKSGNSAGYDLGKLFQ